jgi:hypothetical protein
MGAVAKSFMRKGFLIYEEMRKYLVIYGEAVVINYFATAPFWIFFYMKKILFSFLSVWHRKKSLLLCITVPVKFLVELKNMGGWFFHQLSFIMSRMKMET